MVRWTPEELRQKIRGPVYPICPAFKKDLSVDSQSVAHYVEFLNAAGVRTLMLTAGTSRFNLLSNEEIAQLNRTVVDANQGRAITIAANPMTGSTSNAIEFARHAEEIGADSVLLYYPERYYGDDHVFDYFKSVAASTKLGVMIHAVPMRNAYTGITLNSQFSVQLCERLAKLGNVIGMKEESGSEAHRYHLAVKMKDRMSLIVAGAAMRMFLSCVLFGVDAYLVGVGSFVPEVEEKFYQAVLDKDFTTALEMVNQYETPFFEVAFPMGWHIAMKGAMNLLGLMPETERLPLQPATAQEREQLQNVLTRLGWL